MDWLQFTEAMVGHLAWPLVVALLIFLLRTQLHQLAERLQELTLPGGMKATFERELQAGRVIAEKIDQLPELRKLQPQAGSEKAAQLDRLVIESPEGAMVLSYLEVERRLRIISEKLGHRYFNIQTTVNDLVERKLLDPEASALLQSLRRARNSAAHGSRVDLTSREVLEFIRQASFVNALLDVAVGKL